jgi:hypothetical protein
LGLADGHSRGSEADMSEHLREFSNVMAIYNRKRRKSAEDCLEAIHSVICLHSQSDEKSVGAIIQCLINYYSGKFDA